MPTHNLAAWVLAWASWLLAFGCGGGDGASGRGAAGVDAVVPYVTVCAQTVCEQELEACRSARDEDRSSCYDSCVYNVDPAGCASACGSAYSGSSSCSCSTDSDECVKRGVTLQPPPLNQELFAETLTYLAQCNPSYGDPPALAEYYARSFRHEYVETLKCTIANGCADTADCEHYSGIGSLGDTICARQQACGKLCDDDLPDSTAAGFIDVEEARYRPALVEQLRRCASEASCDIATACWDALKPAVYLERYPAP